MTIYYDDNGQPQYKVDKDNLTLTWYVARRQVLYPKEVLSRWVVMQGGFPSEQSAYNYAVDQSRKGAIK